jgi:uncharacterized membrane protein YccF (DUF307 family)
MTTTLTANQLSGRATGSLFFTGFGMLWLTLGLYLRQIVSTVFLTGISAGLAILLLAAFWLLRQARRYPKMPEDTARNRTFHRINAIQWAAVIVVSIAFARLHMDAYVLSAITAIVGIHLFPLAKLFRYPMHYVTGAALVAWASASVLLVPAEHLQGVTALGTGILLWISAVITLTLAAVAIRRNSSAPTANSGSLYA